MKFIAVIPLMALGALMIFWPLRFSRILYQLAAAQRELLRGGSLFDMYFPERVEQSRSVRTQIRLIGAVFSAFGVMLEFST